MQLEFKSLNFKFGKRIFVFGKNSLRLLDDSKAEKSVGCKKTSLSERSSGGFTLVEILIVIIVATIITVIILGAFSRYRRNQAVDTSARIVLTALQEARQNTLDSLDASQYGVNFSSNTVYVFKGTALSSGVLTRQFEILKPVEINEISITGGNEVLFERLTGATSNTGYIVVREPDTTEPAKTITIEKTGIAYVE